MSGRARSAGPRGICGLLAMVVLVVVSGCVAPAFDSGAFHRNAVHALDSAVGETRTAALVLRQHLSGRIMRPYADTVVTNSEEALGPVQASFGSVDPPTRADDKLRDDVGGLLSDAGDALAAARIALRTHDARGMRKSVGELGSLADRMEQLSERLS